MEIFDKRDAMLVIQPFFFPPHPTTGLLDDIQFQRD